MLRNVFGGEGFLLSDIFFREKSKGKNVFWVGLKRVYLWA